MTAIDQLRKLADHQQRTARLDLAVAEQARAAQQRQVDDSAAMFATTLEFQADGVLDELNRHTFALRAEMSRRGAERRLLERQRDVNRRLEAVRNAGREKGTLDRLIERRDDAIGEDRARREQRQLDESGLTGWWRN